MSEDRLRQGRAYVRQLRDEGRTDEEIRRGLVTAGWGEGDVATLLHGRRPLPPDTPRSEQSVEAPTDAGWQMPEAVVDKPPVPAHVPLHAPARAPAQASAHSKGPHVRHATHAPREQVVTQRPGELTFMIVLIDVVMLLSLTGPVMLMAAVASGASRSSLGIAPFESALVLGIALVLGAIYLAILVVAHFLWNGYSWARVVMMVLLGLFILSALHGLMTGGGILAALYALVAGLLLVVLFKQDVKAYCCR